MSKPKTFKFFNEIRIEESEGKRLRVKGFLQHYNVVNINGQRDRRNAYKKWLEAFRNGKAALPLVVMHQSKGATDIVGKFVEIEDTDEGLVGTAEFLDTEAIEREIIPRVKNGIWPAFSTEGVVTEMVYTDDYKVYEVCNAYLTAVSLVSMPADIEAQAQIINQITPKKSKDMSKKQSIIAAMRNSLSGEISEAIRSSIEAAIAELEASDVEVSINEAIKSVVDKLQGLATVEQLAAVENAVKAMLAKAEAPKENYLESAQARRDFLNAVRSGKINFSNEWRKKLVENAVQDPDNVLAPAAVLSFIADGLKNSRLWGLLNHTGLKAFKLGWNNNSMSADKLQQAGGHTPGETKPVENIVLELRELRCQSILKLTELDYETVRNCDDENVLLEYVQNELLRGVIRILEKCVLVGDGNDDAKRHITSIMPIVGDPWAQTHTYTEDDPLAGVMEGVAKIRTDGELVLVADKLTILRLKTQKHGPSSTATYLTDEQLAGVLGVAHIVPTGGGVSLGNRIVIFDREQYRTVGDEPVQLYGYEIRTNAHVFEQVIMAGGGLTSKGAAVVLSQAANRGGDTTTTDTKVGPK